MVTITREYAQRISGNTDQEVMITWLGDRTPLLLIAYSRFLWTTSSLKMTGKLSTGDSTGSRSPEDLQGCREQPPPEQRLNCLCCT